MLRFKNFKYFVVNLSCDVVVQGAYKLKKLSFKYILQYSFKSYKNKQDENFQKSSLCNDYWLRRFCFRRSECALVSKQYARNVSNIGDQICLERLKILKCIFQKPRSLCISKLSNVLFMSSPNRKSFQTCLVPIMTNVPICKLVI